MSDPPLVAVGDPVGAVGRHGEGSWDDRLAMEAGVQSDLLSAVARREECDLAPLNGILIEVRD
jgi:hypothetical protein